MIQAENARLMADVKDINSQNAALKILKMEAEQSRDKLQNESDALNIELGDMRSRVTTANLRCADAQAELLQAQADHDQAQAEARVDKQLLAQVNEEQDKAVAEKLAAQQEPPQSAAAAAGAAAGSTSTACNRSTSGKKTGDSGATPGEEHFEDAEEGDFQKLKHYSTVKEYFNELSILIKRLQKVERIHTANMYYNALAMIRRYERRLDQLTLGYLAEHANSVDIGIRRAINEITMEANAMPLKARERLDAIPRAEEAGDIQTSNNCTSKKGCSTSDSTRDSSKSGGSTPGSATPPEDPKDSARQKQQPKGLPSASGGLDLASLLQHTAVHRPQKRDRLRCRRQGRSRPQRVLHCTPQALEQDPSRCPGRALQLCQAPWVTKNQTLLWIGCTLRSELNSSRGTTLFRFRFSTRCSRSRRCAALSLTTSSSPCRPTPPATLSSLGASRSKSVAMTARSSPTSTKLPNVHSLSRVCSRTCKS